MTIQPRTATEVFEFDQEAEAGNHTAQGVAVLARGVEREHGAVEELGAQFG